MKTLIQLVDTNSQMIEKWKAHFAGCSDVVIYHGDFFHLKTDCVVSPANSYGFMEGGLDLAISRKLGWHVQEKLQKQIKEKYDGELLVGQAELIETGNNDIPFLIAAPTMRVPMLLFETVNVYLAARAVFLLLKQEKRIKSVTMSGLGTGVGQIPYEFCAKQMRQAYDDFFCGKYEFPDSCITAQYRHKALFS